MKNFRNNKQLFIIGGIFIIFCIIVIFILLQLRKNEKTFLSTPFLELQDTQVIDADTVALFNGRSFNYYNPVDNSISKTNVQNLLVPSIQDIQWSQDGKWASFQSSFHTEFDDIGKKLSSEGLSLNSTYVWLINLETGKLTHFGPTNTKGMFGDKYFYFYPEPGSTDLPLVSRYSLEDDTLDTNFSVASDDETLIINSDKIYIRSVEEDEKYTIRQVTADGASDVLVTCSNSVVGVVNEEYAYCYEEYPLNQKGIEQEGLLAAPGDLKIFKMGEEKPKKTYKDLMSDSIIKTLGGKLLVYSTPTESHPHGVLLSYDAKNNKERKLDVINFGESKDVKFYETPLVVDISYASEDMFILKRIDGFVLASDKKDRNIGYTDGYYEIGEPIIGEDFILSSNKDKRSYFVEMIDGLSKESLRIAIGQLENNGVKTDLVLVEY